MSVEIRRNQARQLMEKYPGMVPVQIKHFRFDTDDVRIMIARNADVRRLLFEIRFNMGMVYSDAIFISTPDGILLPVTSSIGYVYLRYKSDDDILHLVMHKESTFGCDLP